MVYITGDMHGDLSRFKNPIFKKLKAGDVLIVCGDFGFIWDGSRQEKQNLKKLREMPFTIAFVDGCHENFDILEQSFRTVRWRGGRAHLIAPNIFHMMRGEIFTIDDRTFFAFGGGHSQDFEFRQGRNWWQREQPTHAEIRRAIHNLNEHNAQVDYIITHEPPASLKDCLGVDVQQRLEIHTFFEDIIKQCQYRKWFFGKCHMDRFIPMKFYAMFEDVLPVESETADAAESRHLRKNKSSKCKKTARCFLTLRVSGCFSLFGFFLFGFFGWQPNPLSLGFFP